MTFCDFEEEPLNENGKMAFELPEGVPPLRSLYLYMSNSCNLACRHCWITPRFVNGKPDPGDVIDVDALRRAVAEAKTIGLISAKLTGGEPMLHPRFMNIVDMLTAEDLALTMETNGTLLTADSARYLKEETNVEFVSVSIDGANAETHDRFRGVPGSFAAALKGLEYLRNAGFEGTQVIMSPHLGNIGQIDAVVELATRYGAASVKFTPVISAGRGKTMHVQGEALGFDDHLALAKYVFGKLRQSARIDVIISLPPALSPIRELRLTRGKTNDCGVRNILGILGGGEVALCGIGRSIPELVYGQIGRNSIREIWFSNEKLKDLRQALDDLKNYPGICGRCVFAKHCRTSCVAINYVNDERIVWPGRLCAEAARRGVFPESRLRI